MPGAASLPELELEVEHEKKPQIGGQMRLGTLAGRKCYGVSFLSWNKRVCNQNVVEVMNEL